MNTQASGLAALLPLFRELNNLERIRVAGKAGSWAERAFVRIRARLVAGEDPRDLALAGTTRAVAATLLAGIDADVLAIARNAMGQTPGGSLPLVDSRTGQTEEIVVPPEQGRSPIAVGI